VKCNTKPISGGAQLGANRTNKANSWLRLGPGADSAKQTQSGAARVGSAGQFCGTKPIPAVGPGCQGRNAPNKAKLGQAEACGDGRSSRPIVPNKPNSPIADSGQPYAGTPLRAAEPEAGCTNKPNSCRDAEPAIRVPRRANVRNEANWRRGHVRGKSFMSKELWCIVHAWDLGKTKPIFSGQDSPPFQSDADCAKQSQFVRSGGSLS
jgi:hypothetical protein